MNFDFIKIGALVGIVIGFWNGIKDFLKKIFSLFIQEVEINTKEANETLTSYLVSNYRLVNIYTKSFGALNEYLRNGKYGQIVFEKFGFNTLIFKSNSKFLRLIPNIFFYVPTKEKESSKGEKGELDNESDEKPLAKLYFFRNSLNIENILKKASEFQNNATWNLELRELKQTRFDIFYIPNKSNMHNAFFSKTSSGLSWHMQSRYKLLNYKSEEIGRYSQNNGKALENLYFPKPIKDLINSIRIWKKSEDWYKAKGIPWKRGWLLYGIPGTGKTALARAFAEDLNIPIYVYSLSQVNNNDLLLAWKNMQLNVPCIALIEDIDNVFHGRKNIFSTGNMFNSMFNKADEESENIGTSNVLTFDCLLNCIDGIDKSDGIFTIITTNDISKIDKAIGKPVIDESGNMNFISTRPGRIDRAIELSYMDKGCKIELAKKIIDVNENAFLEVLNHINLEILETPAQFQEFCSNLALKYFWKANN